MKIHKQKLFDVLSAICIVVSVRRIFTDVVVTRTPNGFNSIEILGS